jgi:hypothetical protein
MRTDLEYHRAMRYWTPVLALLLAAFFTLSARAQVNGAPPSVTSFGFGGHPGFNGPPPSVTSLGPQGVTPAHGGIHQGPHQPGFRPEPGHHHHQQQVYAYPYYVPYYPMVDPYNGPVADQSLADPPDDPDDYQGGPTIFDRRGPGKRAANDYPGETRKAAVSRPPVPAPVEKDFAVATAITRAPDPPEASQPSTILIFKDGHKQEIGNYAIVGANLYDLMPGRRLKVALADLDLAATQKANDDQGIDFKLPELPNGN